MFVGSFEGDFAQFQFDVKAAVNELKAHRVENLLIDVTNNDGSYTIHIKVQKSDITSRRWIRLLEFVPLSVPCR
jgi:hypothetical protein